MNSKQKKMIKRLVEYGGYLPYKNAKTDEIKELRGQLICLQDVKISQLSGMPHGSGVSDVSGNSALKSIEIREEIQELEGELKQETEKYIQMEQMIKRLTKEQREIIQLRFVDKRSWGNIADFLGYNQTYIFRLQKKIAEKLVELESISFL